MDLGPWMARNSKAAQDCPSLNIFALLQWSSKFTILHAHVHSDTHLSMTWMHACSYGMECKLCRLLLSKIAISNKNLLPCLATFCLLSSLLLTSLPRSPLSSLPPSLPPPYLLTNLHFSECYHNCRTLTPAFLTHCVQLARLDPKKL